jgi:hypothetical protein
MKNTFSRFLLCLQMLATLHGSAEENPKLSAPQVRVQVEYIDLSQELFTDLMFGAEAVADDTQLRNKLAELIKQNKARVMETMLCTVRSGQKSNSYSLEEMIYPTEYEPATIPPQPEAKSEENKAPVTDVAIGPQPDSFETRNIGSTLEVEPIVGSDGKTIDLKVEPEIVYHTGQQMWSEWKGTQGDASVKTPKFYVLRLSSSVRLSSGKPMLVAAQTPKDPNGSPDAKRKLMVFVRADVLPSQP